MKKNSFCQTLSRVTPDWDCRSLTVGLTDGGVRRLSSNCPRLASLSLSNTAVTDRSLLTLSVSRARDTVRELRINGCVNITDTGIEVVTLAQLYFVNW